MTARLSVTICVLHQLGGERVAAECFAALRKIVGATVAGYADDHLDYFVPPQNVLTLNDRHWLSRDVCGAETSQPVGHFTANAGTTPRRHHQGAPRQHAISWVVQRVNAFAPKLPITGVIVLILVMFSPSYRRHVCRSQLLPQRLSRFLANRQRNHQKTPTISSSPVNDQPVRASPRSRSTGARGRDPLGPHVVGQS
jgi:hypothetical protein